MRTRHSEDLTVQRWRVEPRIRAFEFPQSSSEEQAPALWKDLTLASVVALVLWIAAAMIFRF